MRSALPVLLKAHSQARLRRLTTAFSTPRRALLSLLILVLAVVWTGQTVASMLLREPYAPDAFRLWIAVPLFAWFLWHVVRVAWKRPEAAIEWSQEEESLIVAGPFTRREQLTYRFVVILTATLPKAILTIFVLWPDLSWCSPIGLILALVGLELFRMIADIGSCCLSTRAYQFYRTGIVVLLAGMAFVCQPPASSSIAPTTTKQIVELARTQQASLFIESLLKNDFAALLAVPFLWAADVISGQGTFVSLCGKIIVMITSLGLMTWVVNVLDAVWRRSTLKRERDLWHASPTTHEVADPRNVTDSALPWIPFCGPLVWRQCRRAFRYSGSLLISMAIPAMLLCPPLFSVANPVVAFLLVVSGALFYTFVLLPEAIKFDFRLDSDHLCQLKMLPMTPTRVVLGQLVTPVAMACLFQTTLFVAAGIYRSIDVHLVLGAMALCLPLTILFVALDNLTFLLYPHRPTQEGFEAFLRTILKFTGKSLLLALFAGAIFVWAPVAATLSDVAGLVSARTVFAAGMMLGITGLAGLAVGCVVSAFRRFDVSLHGTT